MRLTRTLLAIGTVAALSACGNEPADDDGPTPLAAVLEDSGDYDGERVTVTAAYFGAFEQSVLSDGLAESFPPQPMTPQVWVDAQPPDECLEQSEQVAWAEQVIATGTFHEGGGFGHLGDYEYELADSEIRCA